MEFIENKWYKIKGTKDSYRKISSNTTNGYGHIPYNESINRGIWQKVEETCDANNGRLILADLLEIIDFLPDTHPDKLEFIFGTATFNINYNKLLEILTKYGIN